MVKSYYLLIISLFCLFTSCGKDENNYSDDIDGEFVPTDVIVKIKDGVSTADVFNFINLFDHEVAYLKYGTYVSELPSEIVCSTF